MTDALDSMISTNYTLDFTEFFNFDPGQIFVDMIETVGTMLINEFLSILNNLLTNILSGMLRTETLIDGDVLTATTITDIYQFIYMVAVALIGLKVLFKGWQIYILWRDGDADTSPMDMLVGSAQAVCVIMAFPLLYEYMADITQFFAEGIIGEIGYFEGADLNDGVEAFLGIATGLVDILLLLVYLVLLLVLWIILLKRGFELFILRLGIPMACLGLIDSDMGLFKNYMLILYKTLITSVIQIAIMSLSIKLSLSGSRINIFIGIAAILTAFGTPVIMQSILIPTGVGVTSKIHSASMAVNSIRKLIGK